ncbi:MAG: PrsW family intramembrane metalloprotease [Cyanobacteriota bacterium]|nr:PrsW family intramembrane metalloprotease [Cyanobacteriota bacterium]
MTKLIVTLVVLGILTTVYTTIVRSIDRFEKEPPRYLLYAFLWGAVPAIALSIIFEVLFSIPLRNWLGDNPNQYNLAILAIDAPITEEIIKGMFVAIVYRRRRHEFDGWVDGMVYGAMVGFGFAYIENVQYLMGTDTWERWAQLLILRAVIFGGMHGFWTALTGIGFGVARYSSQIWQRILAIFLGLTAAMSMHMVHNAATALTGLTRGFSFALALFDYSFLLMIMIILWEVAGRVERQYLQTYLREEVPLILSSKYYEAICTPGQEAWQVLGLNSAQQREIVQVAAELAQKKRQFHQLGEEDGNTSRIYELREQLRQKVMASRQDATPMCNG